MEQSEQIQQQSPQVAISPIHCANWQILLWSKPVVFYCYIYTAQKELVKICHTENTLIRKPQDLLKSQFRHLGAFHVSNHFWEICFKYLIPAWLLQEFGSYSINGIGPNVFGWCLAQSAVQVLTWTVKCLLWAWNLKFQISMVAEWGLFLGLL